MKLMVNKRDIIKGFFISFLGIFLIIFKTTILQAQETKPNLLIIQTDEHNYRTLGCYRETMSKEMAYIWGEESYVTTPNIDKMADEGALCTSFYASSPVCTPSRASFVSGLYPVATGSPSNNKPMNDEIVTFAETLQRNGYSTSYVGKWHLDGNAKPGFAPERKFGFEDNRYMFNRGHWKAFRETPKGMKFLGEFKPEKNSYSYDTKNATEETYATDFLFEKALEIIERDKNGPFCLMLSIPDPHGGNKVRPPYDTMYEDMYFENPASMDVDPETNPKWNNINGRKNVAGRKLNQHAMAQYFGMVKLIDDNIGKILNYLEESGLEENTIVVFTSDHGDLMGEHKKHNKGLPYETSAGIPFVIKYPEKILAGKKIHKALTNVDFAPTILNIMEVEGEQPEYHGIDASELFLNDEKEINEDRITYITNAGARWVAAVSDRYKLVLSPNDEPWLFDLRKDPNEEINYYNHNDYQDIAEEYREELLEMVTKFNDPILIDEKLIY
ncbi:sulfatase family protein [Christiangramia crocea]|uniref:Sulfatase n=1 Tax=Christiangramia crocea TaxID=2904124 RepID=A0A9X2A6Q1_9FLAO|nr:sulfatase [Gramella crocea]MCG9972539.1 sulfatase [Gramella crocea]